MDLNDEGALGDDDVLILDVALDDGVILERAFADKNMLYVVLDDEDAELPDVALGDVVAALLDVALVFVDVVLLDVALGDMEAE